MSENLKQGIVAVLLVIGVIFSFLYAKEAHQNIIGPEYQFNVTDDSVTVYDGQRTVGTIKINGTLDSLITFDNQ